MIRAEVQGNAVILTADHDGRRDLIDAYRAGGYSRVEMAVAEGLHERWEFIAPEAVGALTDSPILAECDGIDRDDHGDLKAVGRVCWYPNYMVTDPWYTLAKTGSVTFTLAD